MENGKNGGRRNVVPVGLHVALSCDDASEKCPVEKDAEKGTEKKRGLTGDGNFKTDALQVCAGFVTVGGKTFDIQPIYSTLTNHGWDCKRNLRLVGGSDGSVDSDLLI